MIRIALIGQPNCGKSALFNSVAGYKAMTANFPGTTLEYLSSPITLNRENFILVDLPGLYSLSSPESEELVSRRYLMQEQPDAVIHVIDASVLSRSLELTLELLDLQIPLVVCLNMLDEARKKGIEIDGEHLSHDLGVPVVPTIAIQGQGVADLFNKALAAAKQRSKGNIFFLSQDIEKPIAELQSLVQKKTAARMGLSTRLLSLKLIEEDAGFEQQAFAIQPDLMQPLQKLRTRISDLHGRPADMVIASERHALAVNLFEHVATVRARGPKPWPERLDQYIMHPLWGYLILGMILLGLFTLVFGLGKELETPLLALFDKGSQYLHVYLKPGSLFSTLANGLIQGFSGGVGIVLPYLVPFLIGLSLLEDLGYLPRAAFLMDSIMHRIGLHGKSIIPFVLSYGCNVPAIMATRVLERPRDRYLTATLVTLIPCAARTTVIFGLIGFYLGPWQALLLYLLNIVVIAVAGKVLSRLMPEYSPGLVLEIPPYRFPILKALWKKTWFRLREFIVIAWPLLIVGSLILSLMDYFRLSNPINSLFAPLVQTALGLPKDLGIPLVFGILRKELTLIMMVQALGTNDFAGVMTQTQMFVFTVFSLFYVPCLATLGMLRSVLGMRAMVFVLLFTTCLGILIALLIRLLFTFF